MRWYSFCVIFFVACGGNSERASSGDAGGHSYPDPGKEVSQVAEPDGGQPTDGGTTDTDAADTKGAKPDVAVKDTAGPSDSGPVDVAPVPDTKEPLDVEPDPDVAYFDAGQVDPGGSLAKDASQECEALGLAEQWEGTFDGSINSNLGNSGASGTMSFEIGCFAGKFIVSGEMTGVGEGQPFNVKLQGTYNPNNQTIKCKLIDGTVQLFFLLPIAFEGQLEGVYDGTQFLGDWSGENTDKLILDAKGSGTWNAQPK